MAKKIVEARGPYFEEFQQDTKEAFVKERKELQGLEAELKEIELEIAQQQHRKHRAENALNYRRKRNRSDKARNHRLIHKGIAVECVCKDFGVFNRSRILSVGGGDFFGKIAEVQDCGHGGRTEKRERRGEASLRGSGGFGKKGRGVNGIISLQFETDQQE